MQTLWVLFKSRFTHEQRRDYGAFDTQAILDAWQHLPANVINPERNKRQHLSDVLASNEIERDYAYNRALFMRVSQGWYQFNPQLSVRRRLAEEEVWQPIYSALNLPLINEFSGTLVWDSIEKYSAMANMPKPSVPIPAERIIALNEAKLKEAAVLEAEQRAALERWQKEQAASKLTEEPKWGTKKAKQREIERVRKEIEDRKKLF